MSKLSAVFLAVALAVVATACGSSSDSSGGSNNGGGSTSGSGSCTGTQSGVQTCVEFGSAYTSAAVQAACSGQGLTYNSGACTATGRVGRCTFTPSAGASASYTAAFYTGTAADLQAACTAMNGQGGITTTWTPN
jgi:hypothetical protein